MQKLLTLLLCAATLTQTADAQTKRPNRRHAFVTDTLMVHDPVMAWEDGTYYLLSTGHGIQWSTSQDRKTWTVQPTPLLKELPAWTHDSVPGFRGHVWAPDIIRKDGLWWLAYSCSTFGRNTSAIGLMASEKLTGPWRDCGPIVCSREKRDPWNAIDPAFAIGEDGTPWLAWGSFWDGIQLARLDHTMHLAGTPKTIARRISLCDTLKCEPNPTSKYAGRNAIEAPFILKHGGWYYLFVSWDYCCRGALSNYRVVVGRSRTISGPYLDRHGKDMAQGGGTLFLKGDKREYEAAGHCAVYDLPKGETVFVCHGYSIPLNGASLLIQRPVHWTDDGWPEL